MELTHYGTPRESGRYPWGSGENPYQRNASFLKEVDALKQSGMSETDIAKSLGMTTTELRARKSNAKSHNKQEDIARAIRLKDKGYSNTEIGRLMGMGESSVRQLLDPVVQARAKITSATVDILKENVGEKGLVDIGPGTEIYMGITRTKLKTAVAKLVDDGYTVHYIQVEQLGTGNKTTIKVLAPPDTSYSDVYRNRDRIKLIGGYSEDGGHTYNKVSEFKSIDSKRIKVRYNEEGGLDRDGVIEIRRGVDDISLGAARYAQVRIAVDGTHYLKGMAMYSDDMPNGVDIIFNTNKHKGTPKMDTFKQMKDDPDNPFGATVRQKRYLDKDGKEQLSALNIVREEGEWTRWSKSISSQMLSKQNLSLAKKQLDLAYLNKRQEFDEIMGLTNPVVKKQLLASFADDCDASAVHLKAAALPRQAYHVILPFPKMRESEIYAPNYKDGEKVVLIRFPHGGRFEIPELTVNNKNRDAKRLISGAKDAVGINPRVAERLSGADFDGDTVLVIPNNSGQVKTAPALRGLKDFDPKESYPPTATSKRMKKSRVGIEMGSVSNLITDMTIKGANYDEIARAVRHSMVVIDAEKHGLDYTKSARDNGIAALKTKYQGGAKSGASTLISRASAEQRVGTRKVVVDPATGKKIFEYKGETYKDPKTGKILSKTIKSTQMYEAEDATKLSSGSTMETVYANYANRMKGLANTSRKEALSTPRLLYSPIAKENYKPEVESLKAKLLDAQRNAPLERQAQLIANTAVSEKRKHNPEMTAADIKKVKGQELEKARIRVGSHKSRIRISDREWEAIQSGAISSNILEQILDNSDLDHVKALATPRSSVKLNSTKLSKARVMLSAGYTQAEVAESLGVSVTTLMKGLE